MHSLHVTGAIRRVSAVLGALLAAVVVVLALAAVPAGAQYPPSDGGDVDVAGPTAQEDGTPTAAPASSGGTSQGLAFTGATLGGLLVVGLVLVGGGVTVLAVSRRSSAPAA